MGNELAEARSALATAELAATPTQRFAQAQLAAIRAAAAVLSVRGRNQRPGGTSIWLLVSDRVPELQEWADFFGTTQAKRQAVTAGNPETVVSEREADDLLRDASTFVALVDGWLRRHRTDASAAQAS